MASSLLCRTLSRRVVPSGLVRPMTMPATRYFSMLTVDKFTRAEALQRASNLYYQVLGTNWEDGLNLVLDVPFWESELEKVDHMCEPYLCDDEIGPIIRNLHETVNCMYACEDVRDHINELLELSSRAEGVMGSGAAASEEVENMPEQCAMVTKAYEDLLERYPDHHPKIEQTVGHGLAILRQLEKFNFKSSHRFFF
ncbi:conserved hypothetical protein [Perkinsus marinus ATCC 50983]|uniref:DUF6827 domain-containing protein n=1 Tax=Perkinsus marinus (strain ATCC 50983 / TXsc) TaxID=423536 RepID=C5LI82_PERM5|nr:conserved hypothetical protein [Perkinsus marinus ATCC 50983]EER03617.1 conserved hypothetical protein [Perkinsus marinus ATCC 50983]|eukprot:XP_002771801.1 conserved hypothetical protein [Perkinsus marinus ATCC 50983]